MQIIKQPDSFCFTSSLGDIVINPGSEQLVTFSIRMGATVVLPTETYSSDPDGVIYITGLGEVLSAWLRTDGPTAYLLKQQTTVTEFIFIYNGSLEKRHTIMRSDVDFDMTAAAFCNTHFLSLMFSTKTTVAGRRELLAFYDARSTSMTATVNAYYLSAGSIINNTSQRAAIGSGAIKYLDVSPAIFHSEGKRLLYYTVSIGERTIRYELDYTAFLQQTHFVYRNCFGVEDTFTCIGEAASEGKFERYYATFSGGYKNFKRKNLREYTIDTGILSQAAAYALDDMFSSEEIWLYDEHGLIKEIVILDQKVVRSSLPDEMPRFEFTYRLTQSNQRYKTALYGRIFDSTFDKTFN